MGRHASVRGLRVGGEVFCESGECDGGAGDGVVGGWGGAGAELLFDGCKSCGKIRDAGAEGD